MSLSEDRVFDAKAHSSDEEEDDALFNSSSFRAFTPQLDHCERQIIRCVFNDDLEGFINSYAGPSKLLEKSILLGDLQYLSSYRAMKFPNCLNQANIVHIVSLFSAHRILQHLLVDYPAARIWSTTEEGVNALHISAAVGDYMALRMLLQRKDAPISETDSLKRTALHYAAEANLESVITLLSYNKDLLKCVDTDELTPLEFIRFEGRPTVQQFLKLHTDLLNKDGENNQGLESNNGKIVNLRHLKEIPLLLDSYICVYRAQSEQDTICENCNTRYNNHEKLSENEEFMRVMSRRKYGFIRRPTNTFGQFEKTFSPFVSQYVRLVENTSMERLETLLFDLWGLPKPGLVLSFYGTDSFSPSLYKLLQKSLGRITRQTRTWILTDGREKCAGDVVSKVVKAYAEAYGMNQLRVICLVPWRRLYNSQVLRCSDYMGREQVDFPKKPPGNDIRIQLAENHTHYIFLDSRENLKDLPLCRAQFEAFVSHLSDQIDGVSNFYDDKEPHKFGYKQRSALSIPKRLNSPFQPPIGSITNRVPVCGILIEGDRSNLPGISYALRQNIPFVVISDTGGLAKALEIFVKFMKQLLQGEVNETFQLKWSNCKYRLRSLMERAKGVVEFEPSDEQYLLEILERAYLLEFITSTYEGATEMDARILQSLVKKGISFFCDVYCNLQWAKSVSYSLN
ncbi:unnamed protein product [Rodentolepis nana]|uniref:LSDAT_euk domain-containing protein n=1 Tax=Rodentolepis nana TaxID=102285 RepID=A0A0R3TR96_RODNA|nr:unnamed protein product [Rodentolepis nana]